MKLDELLREKRSAIHKRWVRLILDTYPADTRRFLGKQKDPFANPVGNAIAKETDQICGILFEGFDPERLTPLLDRIVRIRAVQDFSPSQALAFVFLLKRAIRSELEDEIRQDLLSRELSDFETRIDRLALLAFEIYMTCKEKLYEIRADQSCRQVSRLLERAGLISEIPKWEPHSKENDPK